VDSTATSTTATSTTASREPSPSRPELAHTEQVLTPGELCSDSLGRLRVDAAKRQAARSMRIAEERGFFARLHAERLERGQKLAEFQSGRHSARQAAIDADQAARNQALEELQSIRRSPREAACAELGLAVVAQEAAPNSVPALAFSKMTGNSLKERGLSKQFSHRLGALEQRLEADVELLDGQFDRLVETNRELALRLQALEMNAAAVRTEYANVTEELQAAVDKKASVEQLQELSLSVEQRASIEKVEGLYAALEQKASVDQVEEIWAAVRQLASVKQLQKLHEDLERKASGDELREIQAAVGQKVSGDQLRAVQESLERTSAAQMEEVQSAIERKSAAQRRLAREEWKSIAMVSADKLRDFRERHRITAEQSNASWTKVSGADAVRP